MPESYKPGQRRESFGTNAQLAQDRFAWVISELGKMMILVGEDKGHGSDVVLFSPRPGRNRDLAFRFTDCTEEELDAVEKLITTALKWARPVVERRDKEAKNAWAAGDDSYARSYRALPTVVFRKEPQPEHYQSVYDRPENVSSGVKRESGDGDSE